MKKSMDYLVSYSYLQACTGFQLSEGLGRQAGRKHAFLCTVQ